MTGLFLKCDTYGEWMVVMRDEFGNEQPLTNWEPTIEEAAKRAAQQLGRTIYIALQP